MSDYFLGPPAASRPRTAWGRTAGAAAPPPPVPPAGGGDDATTTPACHEDPSISLLTFAFRSDGDNEALAADGWRWRWAVYFKMVVVFVVSGSLGLLLSPPGWVAGAIFASLASVSAIAPILALHQNSSYLQRKQTVATIITAIALLGSLGALGSTVFVGVNWTCVVSQNVSCVGQGVGEGTPSSAQGVDKDLDIWFRQSAAKAVLLGPLFTALLLPTSRGARWVGIVFQLTVVPAAQVRGGCVWSAAWARQAGGKDFCTPYVRVPASHVCVPVIKH